MATNPKKAKDLDTWRYRNEEAPVSAMAKFKKNFRWFDTESSIDPKTGRKVPGRYGFLSGLGSGLSGFSAGMQGKPWEPLRQQTDGGYDEIMQMAMMAQLMSNPEKFGSLFGQISEDAESAVGGDEGQPVTGVVPPQNMVANSAGAFNPGIAPSGGIKELDPRSIMLKKMMGYDTPQSLQRDVAVKVAEKAATSGEELIADKIKNAMAQETGFDQINQSSRLMASGIRDAMLQHKDYLGNLGIELDSTRGLSGKTFAYTMNTLNALGYNDFMDSVGGGLSTELAIEIGKQIGQGAGMRMGRAMLQAFKDTLPNLKGSSTLASNLNQLSLTMLNSYRKKIVTAVDDRGKPIYKTADARRKAIVDGTDGEVTILKSIFEPFVEAGLYKPEMKTLVNKEKQKVVVPDYMAGHFRNNGFKDVK